MCIMKIAYKCLIWFAFTMLIGMFCAIHYVWSKMPLALTNIVFYIGTYCWFGSLFYTLNENYKQLKKDIKFFESEFVNQKINQTNQKRKTYDKET